MDFVVHLKELGKTGYCPQFNCSVEGGECAVSYNTGVLFAIWTSGIRRFTEAFPNATLEPEVVAHVPGFNYTTNSFQVYVVPELSIVKGFTVHNLYVSVQEFDTQDDLILPHAVFKYARVSIDNANNIMLIQTDKPDVYCMPTISLGKRYEKLVGLEVFPSEIDCTTVEAEMLKYCEISGKDYKGFCERVYECAPEPKSRENFCAVVASAWPRFRHLFIDPVFPEGGD